MSTLFGDIKANQIVIINSYGMMATHDFNVYQEYSTYRELYGDCVNETENDDNFIGWLIQHRDLGTDIEEIADGGVVDFFLELNLLTPTYDQILAVKAFETPAMLELNAHEIAILAAHLNVEVGEEDETIGEILDIFHSNTTAAPLPKEAYTQLTQCIGIRQFHEREKAIIAQRGYVTTSVFADQEDGYSFAYTKGAITKLGYEVVAAMQNFPLETLGKLVDIAASQLLEGKEELKLGYMRSGGDLNFQLVDIDVNQLDAQGIQVKRCEKVKFLVLPDKENRLPWDEGYDHASHPQPIPAGYVPEAQSSATLH